MSGAALPSVWRHLPTFTREQVREAIHAPRITRRQQAVTWQRNLRTAHGRYAGATAAWVDFVRPFDTTKHGTRSRVQRTSAERQHLGQLMHTLQRERLATTSRRQYAGAAADFLNVCWEWNVEPLSGGPQPGLALTAVVVYLMDYCGRRGNKPGSFKTVMSRLRRWAWEQHQAAAPWTAFEK